MVDKYALARKVLLEAVRPALTKLDKGGIAAEQLVLGTGIQESLLIHRQQGGGGPALGLFQMEPSTHDDIWDNYLKYNKNLTGKVEKTLESGQTHSANLLKENDVYAAAMCRVHYLRVSFPLPAQDDVAAMANYWKEHYNTYLGAGKPEEFTDKWPKYVNADTFK